MRNRLLALFVFLQSAIALAFPEMIRHGYSNCTSCHVSPTGGGMLNHYGRASSRELLSSLGSTYPFPDSRYYNIGGDIRYLNYSRDTWKGESTSKKFLMQADLELALTPISGITFVGSAGYYNVDYAKKNYKLEQRRNYMLIDVNDYISVRAGLFFPAYGINFPDHTLVTKRNLGFDEGMQTYNLEVALKSSFAELLITGVNGSEGTISASNKKGYKWTKADGFHGLTVRSAVYAGKSLQLGGSFYSLSGDSMIKTAYGAYFMAGITSSLYLLGEIDLLHEKFLQERYEKRERLGVLKLGLEPFKGIHLVGTFENSSQKAYHWGLTLYPIPHLEFLFEFVRRIGDEKSDEWMVVLHHYL